MRKLTGRVIVVVAVLTLLAAPAYAGGGGHGCYRDPNQRPARMDTVQVTDNCFMPGGVVVNTGEAVRWINTGSAHTVTFKEWDAGDIWNGVAIRFNNPGTYAYECRYHPGMTGEVHVTGDARPGPVMKLVNASSGPRQVASSDYKLVGASSAAGTNAPTTVRLEVDALSGVLLVLVGLSVGAGVALAVRSARPKTQTPAQPPADATFEPAGVTH